MFRIFKKAWIPLLLVVVVALGGYIVLRVRDSFGANAYTSNGDANADDTKPFNPKHITYEVTAPSGGTVSVNFLDEDGQPHLVEDAPLPWSHTIVTTLPSMSANIVAQGDTSIQHLRCRVIVDGEVRDDRSIDQYEPFIYCLVKSV
ncbi:MmpS family transport accessory protein [[Mycobacterium] vasticus]|uniref:MmpS family transport accessory protein n=1 Tax=[Mycobacterium] vasticus TaxID=2875777 RepID=A0ABU5Z3S7_9MYCO|nr:MmpS family transport accessory protein [Mycolicibacter sp. MYC017]MEB3072056.1 MmpS family transport accessory protein [Mycolicibacter sp. MYC017]